MLNHVKWLGILWFIMLPGVSRGADDTARVLDSAITQRLTNTANARALFSTIDVDELSQADKLRYRYLEIYLASFKGNFDQAYEDYEVLLTKAEGTPLEVKILSSMIGLATYRYRWKDSFKIADKLVSKFDTMREKDKVEAYRGIFVFYQQSHQYNLSEYYIDATLASPGASAADKCTAMTHQNQIDFDTRTGSYSKSKVMKAINYCEKANFTYNIVVNNLYLSKYHIYMGDYLAAQNLLPKIEPLLNDQNFIYLDVIYDLNSAKLALANDDIDKAATLAEGVVNNQQINDYTEAIIRALAILVDVEKRRGNASAAINYLEQKIALNERVHSQELSRQQAVQQAKFELDKKDTELALMDQKNQLALEEAEKLYVALLLSVTMLATLLLWSYRSRKLQVKFRNLSRVDSLTGAYNRGYIYEHGTRILDKQARAGHTGALVMLDVDHFKRINDSYGHQIGDWVLREIVRTLKNVCADKCTLGRMGGEEFVILLPDTAGADAVAIAESCRAAIEAIDTLVTGKRFVVSASFGVSDTSQVGYKVDNLMAAADLALYQSKQYGRNQVYYYDAKLNDL